MTEREALKAITDTEAALYALRSLYDALKIRYYELRAADAPEKPEPPEVEYVPRPELKETVKPSYVPGGVLIALATVALAIYLVLDVQVILYSLSNCTMSDCALLSSMGMYIAGIVMLVKASRGTKEYEANVLSNKKAMKKYDSELEAARRFNNSQAACYNAETDLYNARLTAAARKLRNVKSQISRVQNAAGRLYPRLESQYKQLSLDPARGGLAYSCLLYDRYSGNINSTVADADRLIHLNRACADAAQALSVPGAYRAVQPSLFKRAAEAEALVKRVCRENETIERSIDQGSPAAANRALDSFLARCI